MSAPPRVAARLRSTTDGPLDVVHAGPDAVYVDLDGVCLGVVSARASQVPCALRSRLPSLPRPRVVVVRDGSLHLDEMALVVGRLASVTVPRVDLAPAPLRAAAGDLVGAGAGLTPYGDDILCGWLALNRAAGVATPQVDQEIRALLPRTSLLSATLLECAMHGEVVPEFAAYLTALGTPDEAAATAALTAVGASSGEGLLQGARWALAA
ncbi:MAG: DUF2877 domain-containing protein [Nocardioides sp.]